MKARHYHAPDEGAKIAAPSVNYASDVYGGEWARANRVGIIVRLMLWYTHAMKLWKWEIR